MKRLCAVLSCCYVAESAIEDFVVCTLHDHPAVRGILESGRIPHAYWSTSGFPIVLPSGPLEDWHFEPIEGTGIPAGECSMLVNLSGTFTPGVCAEYDLMRDP